MDLHTFINRRRRLPWMAAGTFAFASLLIFVLPLHVPMAYRATISASYVGDFNNRVASVVAALFSVGVFVFTVWRKRRDVAVPQPETSKEQLGQGFIALVVGLSALVLAVCGALIAASRMEYLGDAGYFIQQATTRLDTGRALYTQLEFAYGPLLLLPEVWLAKLLHCSVTTAYFIVLVFSESVGLLLLAYVLNELPIRGSLRKGALALFAVGAITPLMGLNYTFFRFAPAMALLQFASRSRSPWRCALVLGVGEALVLLISPEIGFALMVGIVAFAFARTWQAGAIWLVTAAVPVATLGALLLTYGRPYLATIAQFSSGVMNLPVAPYPHLLVLVFALAWVVPVGLGLNMDLKDPGSARLLGFYALTLAYLPAALGRCDPLHVFFNGTPLLVLSLAAVSQSTRGERRAWLGCVLVLVLWEHVVNDRLYEYRTAEVVGRTIMPHLPEKVQKAIINPIARRKPDFAKKLEPSELTEYRLDVSTLEAIVGTAPVATPLEISPTVREALRATDHLKASYNGYFVDVLSVASEEHAIAEFNQARWALLPDEWAGFPVETPANISPVQGFAFPYRQRHPPPYLMGKAFKQNVALNWMAVRQFGEYTLYQKKDAR